MVDAKEVVSVLRQIISKEKFSTVVANPQTELSEDLLMVGKRFVESQGLVAIYGRLVADGETQTVIVISQNDEALTTFFQNAETMKNFHMMGTN